MARNTSTNKEKASAQKASGNLSKSGTRKSAAARSRAAEGEPRILDDRTRRDIVGVGFIIGVIQDSVETCLNSASDVEFAATAEYHAWLKQGRQLPAFMYSKKERQQLGIEA